ncbi:MAG: hypothetical protein HKN21_13575, partial [Candidatus Eisenbacteria bacterium]|nr:hypothetical protein [Candidatus Eisenbacteria bacterium]
MLQAMREQTKIILWITVVAFILLMFLVWGMDYGGGGGNASGRAAGFIGTVNGEGIPVSTYQLALSQNRRFANSQGRDLLPTDELMLEEDTWQNIVDEMLLTQEASKRGLEAHDSEIRTVLYTDPPDIIRSNPNFVNEQGQFDINRYLAILQDPNTDTAFLLNLENYVRGSLPLQKLLTIVQSGAKVSDQEIRESFVDQNEKAQVTYTLVNIAQQPQPSNITDADLQAYFESHRADYELGRRADLNYISIPRRATAEDTLRIVRDLEEFRAEAIKAAQPGADLSAYSDFETLVLTFSDGPNADDGGMTPGYLTTEEMTPAFQSAIAGLEKNEFSQPFQDGAFFHLLQMVDQKNEDGAASYQLRDMALRVEPSDSTLTAVRDLLEAFRNDALETSMSEAAEKHGLTLQRAGDLTETGIAPGLSAVPRISNFALNNPEGTISRVYETNGGWY